MQDTLKRFYEILKKYQQVINALIFLVVIGVMLQLLDSKNISFGRLTSEILSNNHTFYLVFLIAITPLNWAFEALKWQFLAKKIEKISFIAAYKAVLTGLAFSVATPLMAGDYAAKILLLKNQNRKNGLGVAFLGNIMQLFVSVFVGFFCYFYFINTNHPTPIYFHYGLLILLLFFLLLMIFLFTKLLIIRLLISKFAFLEQAENQLKILEKFKINEVNFVFVLSLLRYLVFGFQLVLALQIFGIALPVSVLFCGVAITFLFKTIVPFINFLSDFGVRNAAALYFFSFYKVDLSPVWAATTFIWLINILLPMVIGSVFIFNFRYSLKK